jgi:hypothetical protein
MLGLRLFTRITLPTGRRGRAPADQVVRLRCLGYGHWFSGSLWSVLIGSLGMDQLASLLGVLAGLLDAPRGRRHRHTQVPPLRHRQTHKPHPRLRIAHRHTGGPLFRRGDGDLGSPPTALRPRAPTPPRRRGLYPLSLVTGSVKSRSEVSNPQIISPETRIPYSPECVEGVFSELGLPLYGVLRSSTPGK